MDYGDIYGRYYKAELIPFRPKDKQDHGLLKYLSPSTYSWRLVHSNRDISKTVSHEFIVGRSKSRFIIKVSGAQPDYDGHARLILQQIGGEILKYIGLNIVVRNVGQIKTFSWKCFKKNCNSDLPCWYNLGTVQPQGLLQVTLTFINFDDFPTDIVIEKNESGELEESLEETEDEEIIKNIEEHFPKVEEKLEERRQNNQEIESKTLENSFKQEKLEERLQNQEIKSKTLENSFRQEISERKKFHENYKGSDQQEGNGDVIQNQPVKLEESVSVSLSRVQGSFKDLFLDEENSDVIFILKQQYFPAEYFIPGINIPGTSNLNEAFIEEDYSQMWDNVYKEIELEYMHLDILTQRPLEKEELISIRKNSEHLFFVEENSDGNFTVEKKYYPAHKEVVGARSSVLKAMFNNESIGKKQLVRIDDCNPFVFRDILLYMYTGELDHISKDNVFELYHMSEQYNVKLLQKYCVYFMFNVLSTDEIYKMYYKKVYLNRELLSPASIYFVDNFYEFLEKRRKWQKSGRKETHIFEKKFLRFKKTL